MQTKNIRYILIFLLGLLVFNWPVLSIAGSRGTDVFFLYLFSAWIFIIVLIFVNGLTRPDIQNDLHADTGLSDAVTENSDSSLRKGEGITQTDGSPHV